MKTILEVTTLSRKTLTQILEKHSLSELNKIPDGFSNNIIWNVGHILVSQQLLVYKLSGLPTLTSDVLIEKYRNGSKPESDVSQEEVDLIKGLLSESIEKTIEDYNNNVFVNYQEFTTKLGFCMKNVEDALSFNNYHEGIHLGIIMSIRKHL